LGYVRVSTDKQADRGVSLEAQESKIRAYAQLYELQLGEVIVDAGASAKSLDRPGLQRALAMLRSGAAGGLLVAKLDRLTRSVRDLGDLMETLFGRADSPALLSVGEQLDTRSAAGRMVMNILAVIAQWEREAIGERTRDALAELKSQGVKLGRPPKLSEAASRMAKDLHEAGASYEHVADEMNRLGVPTPTGAGRWWPRTARRAALLDQPEP
jgi:DNA invertase Pin-like site-specific DNA recombinase